MKNKTYILIVCLIIFIVLSASFISSSNKNLTLSANSSTDTVRKKYQEAVVDTAYQYYYRERALQ